MAGENVHHIAGRAGAGSRLVVDSGGLTRVVSAVVPSWKSLGYYRVGDGTSSDSGT